MTYYYITKGYNIMLITLKRFLSKISGVGVIKLPRTEKYLSHLHKGVTNIIRRNARTITDPIPSKGIDIINSLIVRADIRHLTKFNNDMERFVRIQKELSGPAYSEYIKKDIIRENAFCYNEFMSTTEYVLITSRYDILDPLPLGSDSMITWGKIRPLSNLMMDTSEMRLDNTATRLRYEISPPIEAMFGINLTDLLMLYTKYKILNKNNKDITSNNYPFIYSYCILPILYDVSKRWFINIIEDIVLGKLIDKDYIFDKCKLIYGDRTFFARANIDKAIDEVTLLIDNVISGTMKPDQLVNSLLVGHGTSLLAEIQNMRDDHYVLNTNRQYYYLNFIQQYPILSLLVNIYKLQPGATRSEQLKKILEIEIGRLLNTKFWQSTSNPFIRDRIKEKLDSLIM
jgi:hypothetical protein